MDKAKVMATVAEVRSETIEVPGWGSVTVRELRPDEYEHIEAAGLRQGANGQSVFVSQRYLVTRYAVVNEKGDHVFTDADLPWLRGQLMRVLGPIAKKAFELTGLGEADPGN